MELDIRREGTAVTIGEFGTWVLLVVLAFGAFAVWYADKYGR